MTDDEAIRLTRLVHDLINEARSLHVKYSRLDERVRELERQAGARGQPPQPDNLPNGGPVPPVLHQEARS